MTTLLRIGPQESLTQNTVYALPARAVVVMAAAACEVSQDSTTGFVLIASTTTGVQTAGGFVRCTTGNTTMMCKAL